jgi:hypothetical protein
VGSLSTKQLLKVLREITQTAETTLEALKKSRPSEES